MTSANTTADEVRRRLELLESFVADIRAYHDRTGDRAQLKSRINRSLQLVREIVAEAGCTAIVTVAPPPAIGGVVGQVDPLLGLFEDYWGMSLIPKAVDIVEQAIGVVHSPGFLAKIATQSSDAETVDRALAIERVERLCRRFPYVARQLQARHAQRPTLEINDEYDVQDLFHALLRIDFDDVRDEEWTPSYAGGSSRVDFLLKSEQVIIELKKTRQGLGVREIGDQLLIDVGRYEIHPDCRSLVCFVYDPEHRLGNPRGLENDLTRLGDRMELRVVVSPG